MKKLSLLTIAAATALLMQACGGGQKNDSAANADSANAVKDTSSTAVIAVSNEDARFAVEAGDGGLAEVEMGKLAQKKGANPRVKNFGAMMVADHSKANAELMALAKSKNITLPTTPGAAHMEHMTDLTKLSATEFDKSYVDLMIRDHKGDVQKFEDFSKATKDPDLKAFAEKTLPTLKMHLDSINAIKAALK